MSNIERIPGITSFRQASLRQITPRELNGVRLAIPSQPLPHATEIPPNGQTSASIQATFSESAGQLLNANSPESQEQSYTPTSTQTQTHATTHASVSIDPSRSYSDYAAEVFGNYSHYNLLWGIESTIGSPIVISYVDIETRKSNGESTQRRDIQLENGYTISIVHQDALLGEYYEFAVMIFNPDGSLHWVGLANSYLGTIHWAVDIGPDQHSPDQRIFALYGIQDYPQFGEPQRNIHALPPTEVDSSIRMMQYALRRAAIAGGGDDDIAGDDPMGSGDPWASWGDGSDIRNRTPEGPTPEPPPPAYELPETVVTPAPDPAQPPAPTPSPEASPSPGAAPTPSPPYGTAPGTGDEPVVLPPVVVTPPDDPPPPLQPVPPPLGSLPVGPPPLPAPDPPSIPSPPAAGAEQITVYNEETGEEIGSVELTEDGYVVRDMNGTVAGTIALDLGGPVADVGSGTVTDGVSPAQQSIAVVASAMLVNPAAFSGSSAIISGIAVSPAGAVAGVLVIVVGIGWVFWTNSKGDVNDARPLTDEERQRIESNTPFPADPLEPIVSPPSNGEAPEDDLSDDGASDPPQFIPPIVEEYPIQETDPDDIIVSLETETDERGYEIAVGVDAHIINVTGRNGNYPSGGHNLENLMSWLKDNGIKFENVETDNPGIVVIRIEVAPDVSLYKTTYDPSVYSNETITGMAREAGYQATQLRESGVEGGGNARNQYHVEVDGVTFRVYINQNGVVYNIHPV